MGRHLCRLPERSNPIIFNRISILWNCCDVAFCKTTVVPAKSDSFEFCSIFIVHVLRCILKFCCLKIAGFSNRADSKHAKFTGNNCNGPVVFLCWQQSNGILRFCLLTIRTSVRQQDRIRCIVDCIHRHRHKICAAVKVYIYMKKIRKCAQWDTQIALRYSFSLLFSRHVPHTLFYKLHDDDVSDWIYCFVLHDENIILSLHPRCRWQQKPKAANLSFRHIAHSPPDSALP